MTGLPVVLSLTFLFSGWTFMTQFAHPLVDAWAATGFRPPASSRHVAYLRQALGVASILLQTGLLMGLVLSVVLRWRLPFGSLSLLFGLNALLMSFMQDQYRFIPSAVAAGLAADLLLRWLRPSVVRSVALRLFAASVPVIFYAAYFAMLIVTSGVEWAVHLVAGSVVLAGIVGWLLSCAMVPPMQMLNREVSSPNRLGRRTID